MKILGKSESGRHLSGKPTFRRDSRNIERETWIRLVDVTDFKMFAPKVLAMARLVQRCDAPRFRNMDQPRFVIYTRDPTGAERETSMRPNR